MSKTQYDIGIIGHPMADDYGLIMSYLGLCQFIKESGKTFTIIPPPANKKWCKSSVDLFTNLYDCQRKISLVNHHKYNSLIKKYLVGPGVLFDAKTYGIKDMDFCSYVCFKSPLNKLISYGTSFKHNYPTILISRPDKHFEYKELFKRFNHICVSTDVDVNILSEYYDIENCKPVLDAMFLPKRKFFTDFIDIKTLNSKNNIVLYPLNKISRNETHNNVSNLLTSKPIKIATGNIVECKELQEKTIVLDNVDFVNPPETPLSFKDWMQLMFESKYIMCGDYYSLCFCIMFCKNFIVFEDDEDTRIQYLVKILGLQDRVIKNYDSDLAYKLFKTPINYKTVFENLKILRNESIKNLNLMINA